ncbi:MAG: SCO family protein [Bacteroidales bacterium]|jgi:protein SCO1/2|nr:SCO family protein [Bacteroidales bacterium]MDG2080759.1 SCO family protein [Bacteroidales bacterium]|tara:strand:- start:9564 stop:10352 length:789 start_codon:yes stop_codon:yes gene_type:complete
MNRLRVLKSVGLVLVLITFTSSYICAQDELGVYEHLDEYIGDSLVFTDEQFNEINLKQSIDKPTIISLVYYECPGICSPLLNGFAEAMDRTDIELGKDYQAFTISFSPTEQTPLARKKKKTYQKLVAHGDTEGSWKFFTGDSTNINNLLDQVGFKVKKEGREYIHPGTLIVISPNGKITRYLYGSDHFLPFDLKMAVAEAAEEKSGPTINKMLKYCFTYDPEGQKYVLNFTKISGSIILLLAILLLSTLVIKGRKRKKINTK